MRILVPVIAFVFVLFRFSLRHYYLRLYSSLFLSLDAVSLSLSLSVCVRARALYQICVSLRFVFCGLSQVEKKSGGKKHSTNFSSLDFRGLAVHSSTQSIEKEQKAKKNFEKLPLASRLRQKKRNKHNREELLSRARLFIHTHTQRASVAKEKRRRLVDSLERETLVLFFVVACRFRIICTHTHTHKR